MGSSIKQIAYYLPEKTITNKDLEDQFKKWEADKIYKKIGIAERHVVDENQTALDLAYEASVRVLENYDRKRIDFLILCTQSPDYFLPTSSCVLQDKLGLRKDTGAFDFNLGCSGFVYGLAIAKGLISGGIARSILLIMSETYSRHIHPLDLANRTIFGDGAAATVIESSDSEKIFEFVLGTDGSGMNNLIVPNGAMRNARDPMAKEITNASGDISSPNCLYMNGPEIFNFTIESVPVAVKDVLEKNHLTLDQIDYVIFHQANKYMIDFLRKKLGIPENKFFIDMADTGNTVSATIPIGLKKATDQGLVKSGDKVLLCGFGVGYSWGAAVIQI
ncbi:MAG TPA: ketoacyl-ACP synthase III [Bacteroidales bacterium]|nr:ketoacyl-ACP synthase III [Bacteroidales bacterium]